MTSWIQPNPLLVPARVTPDHQATSGEAYQSGLNMALTRSGYMPVNAARKELEPVMEKMREYFEANGMSGQALDGRPWQVFNSITNPAEEMIEGPLADTKFGPFFNPFTTVADDPWKKMEQSWHWRNMNEFLALHGDEIGFKPIDIETLKKKVAERIKNADAEEAAMDRRMAGTDILANIAGNFVAFGTDAVKDPGRHWPLLIGPGGWGFAARSVFREISRRALVESMIGAGIEAWLQPSVRRWRLEYGLDYDWRDFRDAVAVGAGAGLVFGTALQAGYRGWRGPIGKVLARELRRRVDLMPTQEIHRTMLELDREAILSGLRALEHAGVKTGDGVEAVRMADAGRETVEDNKFGYSFGEHAANVIEGEYTTHLDVPMAPRERTAPTGPDDIHHHDNLDATVYRFNPAEIEVDAKTFQFKKEGTDQFGVSEALAGVTQWDAVKAGQIVVYEFADGRRVIADGHQRLGLAKRITAQDPNQKPVIYGSLLREVDGITPDQARAIAAMKNIAEGTGSAIDAARVLRLDPSRLGELPPRSRLVAQARELVDLSDEAFGAVENGVVPARYAAIVGRLVKDPDQQMAIMQVLARAQPENAAQAEAIVRQAINAGFDERTQVTLFGEEHIVESLFGERAKVLDTALKTLRRDRAVFNSLSENRAQIEAGGNVLDATQNLTRSEIDAQAIQIIQVAANRKGELSDALTAAAKQFKETGNTAAAARTFTDAVRRSVERGDLDRTGISGEGRAVDVAPEVPSIAAGPARDILDAFDDPIAGSGVARQAETLETGLRAENPRVAQQPDVALREDLRSIVDAGATPDEIDVHPAIVDALDRARAIPETHLSEGYGSEAWEANRIFHFGDEIEVGYAAGVQRLYQGARRLGWDADGKTPRPVRQERHAVIVLGPPAAGKSAIANKIAQRHGAAVVDPDEAKKALPEFGDGIGSNAVHAESSNLAQLMLRAAVESGDNVVLPKTGGKLGSVKATMEGLKNAGYTVDLIFMNVGTDEAYRRMISRFIDRGRLINPDYMRGIGLKPAETFSILKGKASRHAEIDNNGPLDAERPISQISAENPLEGVELRLRGVGRDISQELPRVEQAAPVRGAEGEQTLIPGVAPITDRARAEAALARPLRGGSAPADVGLFDEGARLQTDLLDLVPDINRVELDPITGELTPVMRTTREVLDEIDQDARMLKSFETCAL